jgi:glycogen debranching enzyme
MTTPRRRLQPALHELTTCLSAPTVAASGADGQIRPEGAQGVLHADLRVLSEAVVTVDGEEPEPISSAPRGASGYRFTGLLRLLGDAVPDPTVRLDRVRQVRAGRVEERLTLSSSAAEPVVVELRVRLAADLAAIDVLKAGGAGAPVRPQVADGACTWAGDDVTATLRAEGADLRAAGDTVELVRAVHLAPRTSVQVSYALDVVDAGGVVAAAPPRADDLPVVVADDPRLARWLEASAADLDALRMTRAGTPDDVFAAAGSPWYLTLFGRDSLWAARLSLPFGTELAGGTLRVLAGLQGAVDDRPSQQQPGKVLHELRRAELVVDGTGTHLPPVYYGTVDATPLFVCLLHDAWRWGLAEDQVRALLPAARAALDWVAGPGDADGDGLLEYVDTEGTGLANQGWKDSGDSVRFADGRQAEPPIALAEVQGYAHEALLHGADLLEALGDGDGTQRYRDAAARLRTRFHEAFWVRDDEQGRYPAMALDGDKAPVDAVASNMGHLPGTGLLDVDDEAVVAALLARPDNDSGFGLRTMSTTSGAYSPLSYHCGSVWPHDTAITLQALSRAGLGEHGRGLVDGLVRAAEAWSYRLPELWSGDPREEVGVPVPYPAACRPQAWSVATAPAVLQVLLGLRVDVPARRAVLRPLRPSPVGALRVDGLLVAGRRCTIEVDAAGEVLVAEGAGLEWVVERGA